MCLDVVFAAGEVDNETVVETGPVTETEPIPTFKQGIRFDTFDLNFCRVKIKAKLVYKNSTLSFCILSLFVFVGVWFFRHCTLPLREMRPFLRSA